MAKAKKTSKPSRKLNYEPKTRSIEDWRHIADMLKMAELNSIEEFWLNIDLPERTFYDAIKKYDFMEEAHYIAKVKIGLRKEKLCEERNLSMNTVTANSLPDYLMRWKLNFEWRAQLKNAFDNNDWATIKKLMDAAVKPY